MRNIYSFEEAFKELSRFEGKQYIREPKRYSLGDDKEEIKQLFLQCLFGYDKTISAETFQFLPEYEQVIDWLVNTNGQGLFLTGDYGRGKSDLIFGVIRPIFLMRERIIIDGCQSRFLQGRLEELKNRAIVYIDDLGSEPIGNDFGQKFEPFNHLLDHTEQYLFPVLLISSNLNGQSFLNRYGERSLDRLERLCTFIKFQGESLRH